LFLLPSVVFGSYLSALIVLPDLVMSRGEPNRVRVAVRDGRAHVGYVTTVT